MQFSEGEVYSFVIVRFLKELPKECMTSDHETSMCSESDFFEIADGFHSLFLAHRERLIQLIVKWWDEHRNSTWPSRPPRLFPLPHRNLSLPEKAVCLAAIHDEVWKGELITPFPTDEFVITNDFLRKKDAARDFRQLTKLVSEIPAADLRHLSRHLDSVKDWLEHLERENRASDDETASSVDPSIESAGSDTGGIQNGEGSEPSREFWNNCRPQQRKIVRFVLDNGGRTERQKLEECEGIFTDPPPSNSTLRRALDRVNDALSMHALGWSLEWSPELADIKAQVWLTSPDKPQD